MDQTNTTGSTQPEIPHQSRLLILGSIFMLAGLGAFGYAVVNFAGGSGVESEPVDPPASVVLEPEADDSASDAVGPALPQVDGESRLVGEYDVEILNTYPSSPSSYTQGLELVDGRLLRSNGQYGRSARQWVDPITGLTETSVDLDQQYFGEGATVALDEVYQLTWKAGTVLIADKDDLSESRTASYEGEGWGLCFDGKRLIRSDGTNVLTFHRPGSFEETGTIDVVAPDGRPVTMLNELECVNDQVLANVYQSDQIVVIDPQSGAVDATIDGSDLRPDGVANDSDHVLNGIAFIEASNTFYLTGKYWPELHEVRLIPKG